MQTWKDSFLAPIFTKTSLFYDLAVLGSETSAKAQPRCIQQAATQRLTLMGGDWAQAGDGLVAVSAPAEPLFLLRLLGQAVFEPQLHLGQPVGLLLHLQVQL